MNHQELLNNYIDARKSVIFEFYHGQRVLLELENLKKECQDHALEYGLDVPSDDEFEI